MIEIQYLIITLAHTMPDTKYICQHSCRQMLISHYQECGITLQNILHDDIQRHAPNLRKICVLCLREIPLSKTATNLHDGIIVLLDVTPFFEQSCSFQNFSRPRNEAATFFGVFLKPDQYRLDWQTINHQDETLFLKKTLKWLCDCSWVILRH